MRGAESWKLGGDYFAGCNCAAACRCVFLDAPDEGNCKVAIAWHVAKGHFGETKLDGLNVVGVFHAPGHMVQGPKWSVALYLDSNAKPDQAEALGKIFGGQAGGHPAVLGKFIGEVKGVKSLPIHFEAKGRNRKVRIPNVLDVEIEAVEGGDPGKEIKISNNPLGVVPGEPMVVARSKKLSYHDHGMDLELSGKNGFYSPFAYAP